MNIGVSGASGHLGRAVVSELVQRADGHKVVAITRTPETVSAAVRAGVKHIVFMSAAGARQEEEPALGTLRPSRSGLVFHRSKMAPQS